MRNSRVMFKALDVQSPPHGHLQYLIPSQPLCLTRFRLKVPHDLNGVGASRALGAEQLSLSFVAGVVEHIGLIMSRPHQDSKLPLPPETELRPIAPGA